MGSSFEIIGPENGRAEVWACGRWLQSYVNADMLQDRGGLKKMDAKTILEEALRLPLSKQRR
jgi:hypothetical protein